LAIALTAGLAAFLGNVCPAFGFVTLEIFDLRQRRKLKLLNISRPGHPHRKGNGFPDLKAKRLCFDGKIKTPEVVFAIPSFISSTTFPIIGPPSMKVTSFLDNPPAKFISSELTKKGRIYS